LAAQAEVLRIATYNADLSAPGPGLLLHDLWKEDLPPQRAAVVAMIAALDADVLVLAGDVHLGDKGLSWALEAIPKDLPVIYVLGNHEFNAVAWATPNEAGEWCRPHTDKNHSQHAAFLDAVVDDSASHRKWISWFESLPLWLDLDGLRIVHACWHPDSMETLGGSTLSRSAITAASGDPLHEAIEIILKGPEVHLGDISYADNDGNPRDKARIRWWDPSATTVATAAVLPGGATSWDGSPLPPLPDSPLQLDFLPADNLNTPVLYGHYWRNGINPTIDNTRSACLDWSIAKGGKLVAYRWSGEQDLTNDHLVAVS
jgi:hypothetical protein